MCYLCKSNDITHTLRIYGDGDTSTRGDGAYGGISAVNIDAVRAYMFCVFSSLREITIPDLVTSIPRNTFELCSALTTVPLGQAVASVDKEAFTYCSSLSSITLRNPSPPSCAADAFTYVPISSCVLYVPKVSKEAYATADVWQDFAEIVEVG